MPYYNGRVEKVNGFHDATPSIPRDCTCPMVFRCFRDARACNSAGSVVIGPGLRVLAQKNH
jgi:hypothetical protein